MDYPDLEILQNTSCCNCAHDEHQDCSLMVQFLVYDGELCECAAKKAADCKCKPGAFGRSEILNGLISEGPDGAPLCRMFAAPGIELETVTQRAKREIRELILGANA